VSPEVGRNFLLGEAEGLEEIGLGKNDLVVVIGHTGKDVELFGGCFKEGLTMRRLRAVGLK
jgi:hypothetical protein